MTPPPRDNLIRALAPGGVEVRTGTDGEAPRIFGHFAVFNEWTEINSWFEGRFLEQIAPGAFKKTISENRDQIRVLLEHGQDPQVGNKPLGQIETLREDDTGAYYEASLVDTSYVRDLIPALEQGLYGASFRFQVMKEEFESKPKQSKQNPEGLPERTISEARLFEFGPVTFPAYASATAGVRSLTDEFMARQLLGRMTDTDKLAAFIAAARNTEPAPPEATTPPDKPQSQEPEPPAATTPTIPTFRSREEYLEWLDWYSRT